MDIRDIGYKQCHLKVPIFPPLTYMLNQYGQKQFRYKQLSLIRNTFIGPNLPYKRLQATFLCSLRAIIGLSLHKGCTMPRTRDRSTYSAQHVSVNHATCFFVWTNFFVFKQLWEILLILQPASFKRNPDYGKTPTRM